MSHNTIQSRSGTPFDPIIVGIVVGACFLFIWAIYLAGYASLMCDPPPAESPARGLCDVAGHPVINPYLASIITPMAATLATYFGAAIGIANTKTSTGLTLQNPWQFLLRWGSLIRSDSKTYSWIQTGAAYVYLLGLLMAGYYLFADLQPPTTETLDTPYTHLIIKTCGSSVAGVIVGVVALALGIKPQKP